MIVPVPVIPERVAVTVLDPTPSAYALPLSATALLIEHTEELEELHDTRELISCVLPSE